MKKFMSHFEITKSTKNLVIEISDVNQVPEDMCTDWKVYEEILFHLVTNAIKFNKNNGSLSIGLSYIQLKFPEDYDLNQFS